LLYTGRIDAHILNLLLENERFPWLTAMLSRYQKEIIRSGISAMNLQLNLVSAVLLEQAKIEKDPKASADAREVAEDIRATRTPPVSADTAAIQECFMQIVKDIKGQAEAISSEQVKATAEVMEIFRSELSKGKGSADLKNLTSEDVTAAVIRTVASAGVDEKDLQDLGAAFRDLLDKMRVKTDDE
ncbi:MAG: hypothetical protein IKM88_06450, partial [Lachnospiraceae bacterium]|nr:hypothetical protein [Lachnospiraceae bacterium]